MNQDNDKHAQSASGTKHAPLILLALAAVVVALTLWQWLGPKWGGNNPSNNAPGRTLADEVRAKCLPLLAAAQERKEKHLPSQTIFEQVAELTTAYIRNVDRNDTDIRPLLVEALMGLDKNDDAEHVVDQLLSLNPRLWRAQWLKGELVRRKGGKYMPFFANAATQTVDVTPVVWAKYGHELFLSSNLDEARNWLEKARAAGQETATVLGDLGEIACDQKRFDDAGKLLSAAIEKDPKDARLCDLLAIAQKASNHLDDAAATLTRGLEQHETPELLMDLGDIRLLQKRYQDAVVVYVKASNFKETCVEASVKAAKIYRDNLPGNSNLALACADKALERRPDDPEIQKLVKSIEDVHFVAAPRR